MLYQVKLPSTKIQPEKSKADMIDILKKFGITDYQWSEYKGEVKLEFEVEIMFNDKPTPVHAVLRPPELKEMRKVWSPKEGRQVKKMVANWPVAYRVMRNYLRERLLMVASGSYPFEDIFLADLVIEHPETHERFRYVDFLRTKGRIPGLALPNMSEEPENVTPPKEETATEIPATQ
jgi:hypothetical protein